MLVFANASLNASASFGSIRAPPHHLPLETLPFNPNAHYSTQSGPADLLATVPWQLQTTQVALSRSAYPSGLPISIPTVVPRKSYLTTAALPNTLGEFDVLKRRSLEFDKARADPSSTEYAACKFRLRKEMFLQFGFGDPEIDWPLDPAKNFFWAEGDRENSKGIDGPFQTAVKVQAAVLSRINAFSATFPIFLNDARPGIAEEDEQMIRPDSPSSQPQSVQQTKTSGKKRTLSPQSSLMDTRSSLFSLWYQVIITNRDAFDHSPELLSSTLGVLHDMFYALFSPLFAGWTYRDYGDNAMPTLEPKLLWGLTEKLGGHILLYHDLLIKQNQVERQLSSGAAAHPAVSNPDVADRFSSKEAVAHGGNHLFWEALMGVPAEFTETFEPSLHARFNAAGNASAVHDRLVQRQACNFASDMMGAFCPHNPEHNRVNKRLQPILVPFFVDSRFSFPNSNLSSTHFLWTLRHYYRELLRFTDVVGLSIQTLPAFIGAMTRACLLVSSYVHCAPTPKAQELYRDHNVFAFSDRDGKVNLFDPMEEVGFYVDAPQSIMGFPKVSAAKNAWFFPLTKDGFNSEFRFLGEMLWPGILSPAPSLPLDSNGLLSADALLDWLLNPAPPRTPLLPLQENQASATLGSAKGQRSESRARKGSHRNRCSSLPRAASPPSKDGTRKFQLPPGEGIGIHRGPSYQVSAFFSDFLSFPSSSAFWENHDDLGKQLPISGEEEANSDVEKTLASAMPAAEATALIESGYELSICSGNQSSLQSNGDHPDNYAPPTLALYQPLPPETIEIIPAIHGPTLLNTVSILQDCCLSSVWISRINQNIGQDADPQRAKEVLLAQMAQIVAAFVSINLQ